MHASRACCRVHARLTPWTRTTVCRQRMDALAHARRLSSERIPWDCPTPRAADGGGSAGLSIYINGATDMHCTELPVQASCSLLCMRAGAMYSRNSMTAAGCLPRPAPFGFVLRPRTRYGNAACQIYAACGDLWDGCPNVNCHVNAWWTIYEYGHSRDTL